MLEVRRGRRGYVGGVVALDLLRQIPDQTSQAEFSRLLIHASLDLAVATRFGKGLGTVSIDQSPLWTWRMGELCYLFLPVVDDDSLYECKEELSGTHDAFVIVPARHEVVMREALNSLMNDNSPIVMSFNGFITWRTTFAALDAKWSRGRVMHYLLSVYNSHAAAADLGRSMMIRMPRSLKRYSVKSSR